jgi:zinc protease
MAGSSASPAGQHAPKSPKPSQREKRLEKINANAPKYGRVSFVETVPFGKALGIDRYALDNGLQILLLTDKSAPVIAYHTWFRVGSRHEKPGKTGLAHLFEHLMFNEVEGLPAGEFDRKMEEAGAENNASTWLDFTQYQEAFPKGQLKTVLGLESKRMSKLVLREPQVTSEKEVVANERRYRVDDDVEGAVDELLWKTAFEKHPYHWPTIGWMADIEGFTTEDCKAFYETYYSPNNASIIAVGDLSEEGILQQISQNYGDLPPATLPIEDIYPEPPQLEERRLEVEKPTPTEKVAVGYKGPALGDADHSIVSVMLDVLFGGRASRVQQRLVRELEIASDVRGHVGPHRDPALIEIFVSLREGKKGEEALAIVEAELDKVCREPVSQSEIDRATARVELGLLSSLETAEGKASTIGFYETLLGEPGAAFERLKHMQRVSPGDILRVARRYLVKTARTVIFVRASGGEK